MTWLYLMPLLKAAASATQDFVGATGFLSGNTALAKIMGFTEKKEIDINNFNKENLTTSAWLQFNQGSHGSYIDPRAPEDKDSDAATVASDAKKAAYAAVTTEMQCQAANFFATNGTFLPVGCSKPAAVVEAVEAVQTSCGYGRVLIELLLLIKIRHAQHKQH
jgi:hypothetical protein